MHPRTQARRIGRGMAAGLLWLSIGGTPTSAYADSLNVRQKEARRIAQEARARFEQAQYDAALQGFREAWDEFPDPAYLYNEAVCLEALHREADAEALLKRYLDRSSDPDNRRLAERRLSALRQRPKKTPAWVHALWLTPLALGGTAGFIYLGVTWNRGSNSAQLPVEIWSYALAY